MDYTTKCEVREDVDGKCGECKLNPTGDVLNPGRSRNNLIPSTWGDWFSAGMNLDSIERDAAHHHDSLVQDPQVEAVQ